MVRIFPPAALLILLCLFYRCGQPMPPMGGKRDSLPPVLVKAVPDDSATNVRSNRITLEFNEYVQLQNLQQQLVVTPVPAVQPIIESKLKEVTIRLKDSLKPNTTYAISFGNAMQDINENNPINNFTYVFSTGPAIDSGKISGRLVIAENGKADSTLVVVLHSNLSDTALHKLRPPYFARVNKEGFFSFRFLAPGTYNIFGLRDQDGGLKFDSPSEMIAFLDRPVTVSAASEPVKLYAYTEKDTAARTYRPVAPKVSRDKNDRRLRFQNNLDNGTLDILGPLQLRFENRPTRFDTSKLILTDTLFRRIAGSRVSVDSNTATIHADWVPGQRYLLLTEKGMADDSLGNGILRNDTLRFPAKREADYGSLSIRLANLDTSRRPVLLFYGGDQLRRNLRLNNSRITISKILPGDYELRVLLDTNGNGIWDPGEYRKRIQPEIVVPRKQKLNIRANWDNEVEIDLQEVINQG
jgi:hypothetical protein